MQSKAEVVSKVAEASGVSQSGVKAVLEAYGDLALQELKAHDDTQVLLPGVGNLRKSYRAERQGRNPQTGEAMTIAGAYSPAMKFRKSFKDALNG